MGAGISECQKHDPVALRGSLQHKFINNQRMAMNGNEWQLMAINGNEWQ